MNCHVFKNIVETKAHVVEHIKEVVRFRMTRLEGIVDDSVNRSFVAMEASLIR